MLCISITKDVIDAITSQRLETGNCSLESQIVAFPLRFDESQPLRNHLGFADGLDTTQISKVRGVDGWHNQSRRMGRCHPTGVPTKCRSLNSADCPLHSLARQPRRCLPLTFSLCDSDNLTLSLCHYSKLGLINNDSTSLFVISPLFPSHSSMISFLTCLFILS